MGYCGRAGRTERAAFTHENKSLIIKKKGTKSGAANTV